MYSYSLRIKATEKTPLMMFDPSGPSFTMIGISVPDNAKEFYDPVLLWVEEYVSNKKEESITYKYSSLLTVNIDLDYFSIQSASMILKMIKQFDILKNIVLNWYFDDEDTKEIGQNFSSMVNMKFNYIEKVEKI